MLQFLETKDSRRRSSAKKLKEGGDRNERGWRKLENNSRHVPTLELGASTTSAAFLVASLADKSYAEHVTLSRPTINDPWATNDWARNSIMEMQHDAASLAPGAATSETVDRERRALPSVRPERRRSAGRKKQEREKGWGGERGKRPRRGESGRTWKKREERERERERERKRARENSEKRRGFKESSGPRPPVFSLYVSTFSSIVSLYPSCTHADKSNPFTGKCCNYAIASLAASQISRAR